MNCLYLHFAPNSQTRLFCCCSVSHSPAESGFVCSLERSASCWEGSGKGLLFAGRRSEEGASTLLHGTLARREGSRRGRCPERSSVCGPSATGHAPLGDGHSVAASARVSGDAAEQTRMRIIMSHVSPAPCSGSEPASPAFSCCHGNSFLTSSGLCGEPASCSRRWGQAQDAGRRPVLRQLWPSPEALASAPSPPTHTHSLLCV